MSRGVVYVVNTRRYLNEAIESFHSLRRHMPHMPVAIVAPRDLFNSELDVIWVPLQGEYDSPIVKLEAYSAPFERVLFLDSDTFINGPLDLLFDVLDGFDIALAHEPTRGWDYSSIAARVFCELNTGVILFRKSERMEQLFHDWAAAYDRLRGEQGLVNDQPAFREVLWLARDCRLATLPTEFHFVTGKPNYVAWDPIVLHGRERFEPIIAALAKAGRPYRAYHPELGILPGLAGKRSLLRLYARITAAVLTRLFRSRAARSSPGAWVALAARERGGNKAAG